MRENASVLCTAVNIFVCDSYSVCYAQKERSCVSEISHMLTTPTVLEYSNIDCSPSTTAVETHADACVCIVCSTVTLVHVICCNTSILELVHVSRVVGLDKSTIFSQELATLTATITYSVVV